MGQVFSCVSKTKTDDETATKSPKKKRFLLKDKNKQTSNDAQADVKVAEEDIQPIDINHVQTAAPGAEPEIIRVPVVLLKPAPANYKTPDPQKSTSAEEAVNSLDLSSCPEPVKLNTANSDYAPQTVDQLASDIGHQDARPATWNDLYWNLIGDRGLKADEEKVKALFSWLCSIPMGTDAFITLEALKEAEKEGVLYAKEACQRKSANPPLDSPEVVVNELTSGKTTYFNAFESLCRYSNLPCCTIKGLAKGVDYAVGMNLTQHMPAKTDKIPPALARLQHAWCAVKMNGKWALFDPIWAAQRLAMSANARTSMVNKHGQMDNETDMFYFNADPTKFIHSHFPFDESWQLLKTSVTLQEFEEGVLLKPSFFTNGLGLFSHQEGVVPIQNKLILTLAIPPTLINVLLFTFNLRSEGRDTMPENLSLTRLGIHEISKADCTVTFTFRFPKAGVYRLTIYARKVGDQYFTDVCEYQVEAKGVMPQSEAGDVRRSRLEIPLFPPTSQSQYGPAEKAAELGITTVPHALGVNLKCLSGSLDVFFTTVNQNAKLPRLTARLKTLVKVDPVQLEALLVRVVEPVVGSENALSDSSKSEATMPMIAITAYFPMAGEYALEVYGAPADAAEDASYFLVWQFLVDVEYGVELKDHVCERLPTTNLGPMDEKWAKLGLRTVSHPDPLIHVQASKTLDLQRARSKNELLQEYAAQGEKSELKSPAEVTELEPPTNTLEQEIDPRACDLTITIEKPADVQLCTIGQLVDISATEEKDETMFLVQQVDEPEPNRSTAGRYTQLHYYIRIPHGDHFYKLYIYAAAIDANPAMSIPLVYTYLIRAPSRMLASELPYIGVKHGPFPEKVEQQKNKP